MNPALIAGGLQLAGGLFGGSSRKKAAEEVFDAVKQKLKDSTASADFAISQISADRAAAAEYDAAHSGYDLAKLRDEAQAAGFNPLTVLAATGGQGYSRGLISSPFISMSDAMFRKADLEASHANSLQGGAGQATVDTAGYLGDAIAAAGNAYFGQANEMARDLTERQKIAAMASPVGFGTTAFGSPVRGITASPSKVTVGTPFTTFFEKASDWVTNRASRLWNDRETEFVSNKDLPFTATVTDYQGNKSVIINPDLDIDSIFDPNFWLAVGSLGGQQLGRAASDALRWGYVKASDWQALGGDQPFEGKKSWDQTDMVFRP